MITLNTQQHLKDQLLILFRHFRFSLSRCFLSYYLFSNSHAQRNIFSIIYIAYRILWVFVMQYHSREKWKSILVGSMDRVLFAAEPDFPKILVLRPPQNTSNVNIEWAGKSKNVYSLCDQLLASLIYLNFIILILTCF